MSLVTQIRQVLRRDVRDARWLLLAYGVMLVFAVVQGRRALVPPPIDAGAPFESLEWSFAAAIAAPLLLLVVSAALALHFAPRVGADLRDGDGWLTLPIAPEAIWAARMVWLVSAVVASLVVAWLVLRPVPVSATTQFLTAGAIALNAAAITLAGVLGAIAAGSMRRLLLWAVAAIVFVPLSGFALTSVGIAPRIGEWIERLGDSVALLALPSFILLLLVASLAVYLLVRLRMLPWWVRATSAGLAVALVVVNAARSPVPERPEPVATLPALLTVQNTKAILVRGPFGITSIGESDIESYVARRQQTSATARIATDTERAMSSPNAAIHTLQLRPRVTPMRPNDRLVLRSRSARVRGTTKTWPFRSSQNERIVTAGDPLPGRSLHWLNEVDPNFGGELLAYTSGQDTSLAPLTAVSAEVIIDVERREPLVLATVPLDGRPSVGPWHRFVAATRAAPSDSLNLAIVHLVRPVSLYSGSASTDLAARDVTFALLHEQRGEALHLTKSRSFTGSLGWALSPTLLTGERGALAPSGRASRARADSTDADTFPDADWLREASLVVIGWRTVERGALALEVPVSPLTASRQIATDRTP